MRTPEPDSEQVKAIESEEEAIAVLAGPGSGKTLVLSRRTRFLLRGEKQERALLLTFTNKAAAEMKARALQATPVPSDWISAHTFHSFSMSLLERHGNLLGLNTVFEVPDEEEQAEIVRSLGIHNSDSLRRRLSRHRLRKIPLPTDLELFAQRFDGKKRELGVLDFDDLIFFAAELLEKFEQVARAYGQRFRHILVDEFQDTNRAQFSIVKALVNHCKTISVFADDDQAIFQFAGADPSHIGEFCDELSACRIPLTVNYRCRQRIVECANSLIASDATTSGRVMTASQDGGTVECQVFNTVEDEANWVADRIQELQATGTDSNDIAVLVRTGTRAQTVLRELLAREIEISNWLDKEHESKERRALRLCLAVLQDVMTPRQSSLLVKLFGFCDSSTLASGEILAANSENPAASALQDLRKFVNSGAPLEDTLPFVGIAIETVDEELAFGVRALIGDFLEFQKYDPDFSISRVLAELALVSPGGSPTQGGGIKLASLHTTKGLQWPHVYIIGMEDDTIPHYYSKKSQDGVSSERRLCFVGVCRAEDHLTLSRSKYVGSWIKPRSPFLGEMGL